MKVRCKLLHPEARMPYRKRATDAGYDLYAVSRSLDKDGNLVYGTGLAFEIPEGYVGLVFPRSSIATKDIALSNAVGVIDSSYRGEVTFKFKSAVPVNYDSFSGEYTIYDSDELEAYDIGDRIGQIIIMPYPQIEFEEAESLSDTDRGAGGYGSTGR